MPCQGQLCLRETDKMPSAKESRFLAGISSDWRPERPLVLSSFFVFTPDALASQKTLKIAKWAHFVPGFDSLV